VEEGRSLWETKEDGEQGNITGMVWPRWLGEKWKHNGGAVEGKRVLVGCGDAILIFFFLILLILRQLWLWATCNSPSRWFTRWSGFFFSVL